MPDLEQAVLELVSRPGYQPVKPKVISKQLGLSADDGRELRKVIRRLVKRGQLSYGKKHLVRKSDQAEALRRNSGSITGVYRRNSSGYGFVRPSAAGTAGKPLKDVYIAAKNSLDASSGDTVLVRLHKSRHPKQPGPSGEIAEVVERETNRFVGTYYEQAGSGLVRVDGNVFAQPIAVGDPGAKGAQPNDKVVLEMVRFPTHLHDGEGVLIEVLGPRGSPGVDTLSILHEFNLPGDFGPEAMETAREQAEAFDASVGEDRVDLSGDTVITIDPEDARDFDDAISLTRLEGGHWRLGVHIADVAHFVPEGSPLDREASDRATSVYLPGMVIPMLPEVICNNLASLQPGRVRYSMSAHIEMTAEGTPLSCEVHKAAIKSARRFTYEEVDAFLADRDAWKFKLQPDVHRLLGEMHELAMILRERRMDRGSLELALPEVKIDLDRQGRVAGAHLTEHTESHQIIEEFMLAANEAVAAKLHAAELIFMRRIHEPPEINKLRALTEFAQELRLTSESLEGRFAIGQLLDKVRGTPQEHAVNYAVLRSMKKAIYSPEEEGHYALASECYCHFTSPIRRYPDLTVHRLLASLARQQWPQQDFGKLAAQAEHCSLREQRAVAAERELNRVKLLDYLSTRIGEEMSGIITGVEEYGLFIQGIELPADGFVHISALEDDYYEYQKRSHALVGNRTGNQFRLGDAVRVTVARVDIDRRELDYRMIGRLRRPTEANRKQTPQSRSARTKQPARKTRRQTQSPVKPSKGSKKKLKQKAKTKKVSKKKPTKQGTAAKGTAKKKPLKKGAGKKKGKQAGRKK